MRKAREQKVVPARAANVRLLLQYDGSRYAGWQIQSNAVTIQGTLAQAIGRICGEPVSPSGSGRTDAGVHARGQVANFHTARILEPAVWMRALNRMLPSDIRVCRVTRASAGFHARKDAVSKKYAYQIYRGKVLPPWQAPYCLHWPNPLDREAMQRAADCLLGAHDMRSFASSGTTVKNFVRIVTRSLFHSRGPLLVYTIEANGFLQHMVRSIVGTLLEVGRGRFTADDFQAILQAGDRSRAGPTAPACGLFLERVSYRRK